MPEPFYRRPTSRTCRQARRHLESVGADLEPINILARSRSIATLEDSIARRGARVIRRNSPEYRRLGEGRIHLSERQLAEILHEHPDLASWPIARTPVGTLPAKDPAVGDVVGTACPGASGGTSGDRLPGPQ